MFPQASRKVHLFPWEPGTGAATSLCGKWMIYVRAGHETAKPKPIEKGIEDCSECVKRYNKS